MIKAIIGKGSQEMFRGEKKATKDYLFTKIRTRRKLSKLATLLIINILLKKEKVQFII